MYFAPADVRRVEKTVAGVLRPEEERFGKTLSEGTPQQVRHDPKVVEAYLGVGAVATMVGSEPAAADPEPPEASQPG